MSAMTDGFFPFLGYALLLAMFVEGVVLALFPTAMQAMMAEFANMGPARLRVIGLASAFVAVIVLAGLARFG
ncbi:MAG: DUF2065 family protein [Alphaproteobacteria bacterium]|jgi:uncharacterized protein YjeT (DUF2065 family)